jgi:hypothetical protein
VPARIFWTSLESGRGGKVSEVLPELGEYRGRLWASRLLCTGDRDIRKIRSRETRVCITVVSAEIPRFFNENSFDIIRSKV